MMNRKSIAGRVHITSTAYGSIVKVGDSVSITPVANVLAVQKRHAHFAGDEGELEQYPIFHRKIEMPVFQAGQGEILKREPYTVPIRVGHIHITGLSTSAVLQIGSTQEVIAESRIKHIRDYT